MIRWLTVPQYMKATKTGRESVDKLVRNKLVISTPPEDGNVLIRYETNDEIEEINKKVEFLTEELMLLSKHLGIRS